jgi:hypothetical protein
MTYTTKKTSSIHKEMKKGGRGAFSSKMPKVREEDFQMTQRRRA